MKTIIPATFPCFYIYFPAFALPSALQNIRLSSFPVSFTICSFCLSLSSISFRRGYFSASMEERMDTGEGDP